MSRVAEAVRMLDGEPYLKLTRGRCAAMRDALEIALKSGRLEKRIAGTVGSLAALMAEVADGHVVTPNPKYSVYLVAHPSV